MKLISAYTAYTIADEYSATAARKALAAMPFPGFSAGIYVDPLTSLHGHC